MVDLLGQSLTELGKLGCMSSLSQRGGLKKKNSPCQCVKGGKGVFAWHVWGILQRLCFELIDVHLLYGKTWLNCAVTVSRHWSHVLVVQVLFMQHGLLQKITWIKKPVSCARFEVWQLVFIIVFWEIQIRVLCIWVNWREKCVKEFKCNYFICPLWSNFVRNSTNNLNLTSVGINFLIKYMDFLKFVFPLFARQQNKSVKGASSSHVEATDCATWWLSMITLAVADLSDVKRVLGVSYY